VIDSFSAEIEAGGRFEFGKNWESFLSEIDEQRIRIAEDATKEMLGRASLDGKTFLDVGSGSGLFSLVALRLGALSVHSFDCDPRSVECTKTLRLRHSTAGGRSDRRWTIERGSVLDDGYVKSLGQFDVVYSWGALHHTGDLWQALENVAPLVACGGLLLLSIYNDQPFWSAYWKRIKRVHNRLSGVARFAMETAFLSYYGVGFFITDLMRGHSPVDRWIGRERRGMSMFVDIRDWIGGYPFEVASPEQIFRFYRDRGFALRNLKTCGGRHGCNQFVFERCGEQ
jgi:2-polyprenyl-3-methyl-5-hydroxy-6-metoxy-1,4-benzoquinol methylase